MIVADASVLVPALSDAGGDGATARAALRDTARHAPHLVDLEIVAALRRMVGRGQVALDHARDTLRRLDRLRLTRHPHRRLLHRIWTLRDNVSPYDASYVALAEVLGATLVTADARLARAPGLRCAVELVT